MLRFVGLLAPPTVALMLLGANPSAGGSFECNCPNGKTCKVDCVCSGVASCGEGDCAGFCTPCDTYPKSATASLAEGLYRTSMMAALGRYSQDDLLQDMTSLLSTSNKSEGFSKTVTAYAGEPRSIVTLRAKSVNPAITLQVLHLPESVYGFFQDQDIYGVLKELLPPPANYQN